MPDSNKINDSLIKHKIDNDLIEKIFLGIDKNKNYSKEQKAKNLVLITSRIDKYLNTEQKIKIMSWCACCKTGKRAKDIRNFSKKYKEKNLHEKIKLLSNIQYMSSPKIKENILTTSIEWKQDNIYKCACTSFTNINIGKVSKTYCLCCAGHFKYHYEKALDIQLNIKSVISSALNSQGKYPCILEYNIIKKA